MADSAGAPPTDAMARADWADFFRIGLAHGILPIAWRSLRAFAADLDDVVAADLRVAYEANARRNLNLVGELRAVIDALGQHSIGAMSWKGPVLAQRAYGDINLRQFFDLDVLVRRDQVGAARDALASLGFEPEKDMTAAEQETYIDHQGELELVRDADGLWVEIHSAIVPTYYGGGTTTDELWQRVCRVEVARVAVPALDIADEMEALCVHGSKHRWERLAWILDIAMLARHMDDSDWSRLTAGASSHGTLRMVRLGLLLAADMCAADSVPGGLLASARSDRAAQALARDVCARLFDPRPNRFDALAFHTRMRERRRDQLRYLVNVAFTPSGADWGALHLPRPLFPLYALTRPVRLAAKYGRRLVSPPR
ncbi:MAG: nucleotidyltransferase family protein [Chloroflexota bacterium]